MYIFEDGVFGKAGSRSRCLICESVLLSYPLISALATMIELVDILNEVTFKRYLLLLETQLTVASPPRFILLIMVFRLQNNASHVSTPSSNVFILSIKSSGLSNLSLQESISQEST